MAIDIKIEGEKQLIKKLGVEVFTKIKNATINQAAKLGRTALSKGTREIYNVPAKTVNKSVEKITGQNRATPARPRAVIRTTKQTKRNPGLLDFGAKQTRKGVTYKVLKNKGRVLLPHAFIARMPRGGVGTFTRDTKKRLPITRKTGPSIVQMVNKVGIKSVNRTVNANLSRLFKQNLKFFMSKIK